MNAVDLFPITYFVVVVVAAVGGFGAGYGIALRASQHQFDEAIRLLEWIIRRGDKEGEA